MLRRRLMRGGGEVLIAPAATPAFGDNEPVADACEIVQHLASVVVVDDRPHRHRHLNRSSVATGPIAALAMPAPLGRMLGIESEMEEGVVMLVSEKDDIAAVPAVAAARSTTRDVFL